MSTMRFNLFGQVHKGLRALLYDTALQLQHTDFTCEQERSSAVDRVRLVNRLFAHHAQIEDSRIFPLIEAYEPAIVEDFEAQHQEDHALSEALENCVLDFGGEDQPAKNGQAGYRLQQQFNAFLAFNVAHMHKEETVINSCLWRYYSDAELVHIVQAISGSIPPEQNRHFIYWMLKGMATQEIVDWYWVVKRSAPPSVFHFFCAVAEEALSAKRWQRVQDAVGEEAVPA